MTDTPDTPDPQPTREPALLPCPFCGGEMLFRAALWPSEGDRDGIIHAAPTDCPLGAFEDDTFDESIIARWNSRFAAVALTAERAEGRRAALEED